MIILGLNLLHADSSAAIVVDGVLLAAAAEERFNRRKHYGGFPTSAIRFCLDHVGARIEDVDHVAIGRDTGANLERKIRYALSHPGEILNLLKVRSKGAKSANLRALFSAELDLDPKRLSFEEHHVEHHLAHIASAYLVSDATHAAGFSFDGSGDFVTAMMAECTEDRIEAKRRTFVPHSLGWLYTTICQVLGYGKYGDEGKVMGLAACGSDEFRELLEEMAPIDSEGFRLNPEYFRPFGHDGGLQITSEGEVSLGRHYSDKLIERVGPPREPHGEIGARERDLACSLQNRFEEVFLHLLRILEKEVPSRDLAMAGGCALNSVANGKIFEHTGFLRTHIQPAAGDEGLAVGAALYVWCCKLGKPRRYVLRDARLGPEFDDSTIRAALDAVDLKASRLDGDALLDSVAERLAAGDIVGWFQGRMEWGPRALGARSILAHPGLAGMKETLNARVKHREPFRPFAPSILVDRQGDYFEGTHPSPFMLHVYPIRPERRAELAATCHVDNTGRLQSVAREENPIYYDLISAFGRKTGTPVLLNTSFNENEPIVCRPEEAIACFSRTRMDALAIGPYLVRKAENPDRPWKDEAV